MKILLTLSALCIMNGAVAASEQAPQTLAIVAPTSMSATMTSHGDMITTPMPEHRRTFVMLIGIAGVAVAFHRGLSGGTRRTGHGS